MRRPAHLDRHSRRRGRRRDPVAGATTTDVRLSLVAYSTPREAYNELIPEFQKTQATA